MSEPYNLIEEELKLIDEIQTLADEQKNIKAVHRNNVQAIRAWRINWRKNAERLSRAHTGLFSEDEWKTINNKIKAINVQLRALNGLEIKNKKSCDVLRGKIGNVQRYIKEVYDQIKNKKTDYESGKHIYQELMKRFNQVIDEYELEVRKQQLIIEKNKAIEENNASIQEREEAYYREATEDVKWINQQLGMLSVEGHYAGFNEQDEIIWIDPDEVGQDCAYRIARANQNGFNSNSLNGLPSLLQDELFAILREDESYSQDVGFIASKITGFINTVINSINLPSKPQIEYQKELKVPELTIFKIDLSGLVLEELPAKLINKSNNIPESILEELEGYAQGQFRHTAENAERINEIAMEYGTLKVSVEPEDKQSVRAINQKIRKLKSVYGQFGKARNSARGEQLINNLVSATSEFLAHTRNQQRVFDQYYEAFNLATIELKNWINQAWWQAGGQPENHQKAGKNDHSEKTYVSRTSNAAYTGESL